LKDDAIPEGAQQQQSPVLAVPGDGPMRFTGDFYRERLGFIRIMAGWTGQPNLPAHGQAAVK